MKKYIVLMLLILLFPSVISAKESIVTLSDCIDGDTAKVMMDDKKVTVRFLAIDTPETVHPKKEEEPFGKEASEYTCSRLTNAKKITLEFDENSETKDKYDRYLAWIFIDDSLLQKELIEKGYAKVAYLYDDYKYTKELEQTQSQAKNAKIGIWQEETKELTKEEIIILSITIVLLIIGCSISIKFRKNLFSKVKRKLRSKIRKSGNKGK